MEPALPQLFAMLTVGTLHPLSSPIEHHATLYSADEPSLGTDPASVDRTCHGTKPVLRPAIFVAGREFDRVWTLALSGQLKHAHMSAHAAALLVSLCGQHLVLDAADE
jgi:hypothetical protein